MPVDKRGTKPHSATVNAGAALGRALEATKISGAALGRKLGVDGSTVSRYVSGETAISLGHLVEAEKVLRLPRGRLLIDAGLVDPDQLGVPPVEAAIAADPHLSQRDRELLTTAYQRYREDGAPRPKPRSR